MRDEHLNTELDELIRASIRLTGEPSPNLNHTLKAALYQKEAALRKQPTTRALPLWYLPMVLNFATFAMLAAVSLLVIRNAYLSCFAAGICIYLALAGILLTVAGVKRTNLKEEMAIRVRKRGALV